MKEPLIILLAVVSGAALMPFFAQKFRIPSAALEIVYGIALFNFFLTHQPQWFGLLREMGLLYLMFIVGMELDIRAFVKNRNFIWYVVVPLSSLIALPVIFHQLGYSFFIGIAVAMVSAGIVLPVLREYELIGTDTGQDIIGMALLGELLSILLLMILDVYHRHGLTVKAGVQGLKFLLLTLLAALFLRLLYIVAWWNPAKVEKVMESEDPVEEGIRAVIFIAVAGAVIAYGSGIEPILGSFMAGLVFSYVFKSKGRFEEKINAIGFGFFIPFFFIGVGADLDVALLKSPASMALAAVLTLLIFASKILPLLVSRITGSGLKDTLATALILSAPLSMMVVAGTLGEKMGYLTENVKNSLVITAVISSILYPTLFRPLVRRIRS